MDLNRKLYTPALTFLLIFSMNEETHIFYNDQQQGDKNILLDLRMMI